LVKYTNSLKEGNVSLKMGDEREKKPMKQEVKDSRKEREGGNSIRPKRKGRPEKQEKKKKSKKHGGNIEQESSPGKFPKRRTLRQRTIQTELMNLWRARTCRGKGGGYAG